MLFTSDARRAGAATTARYRRGAARSRAQDAAKDTAPDGPFAIAEGGPVLHRVELGEQPVRVAG